jgi:phage tail-like protein
MSMPDLGSMASMSAASSAVSAARSVPSMFSGFRKLGVAMRFTVKIGEPVDKIYSLGDWTSCEGLKVDFKFDEIRSGGSYASSNVLPQSVVYSPVTLRRAVEHKTSDTVQSWLREVAAEWDGGSGRPYQGKTVVIELHDVTGVPVAKWQLSEAFPVSWSGPTLSAKSGDVATENLVLAHAGFLENT